MLGLFIKFKKQRIDKYFDQQIIIKHWLRKMRDCRINTIYISTGAQAKGARLRTEQSNPHGTQNKYSNLADLKQQPLKSTNKNLNNVEFSNRDSGKIVMSPNLNKNKQKTHLEQLKTQARIQLQKLTFRQKLVQIQHIFKVVKQLCKTYGYFSVTEAMLQFTFEEVIKISVWIHPDVRSTKPLHPIRKQTQFQCELACVAQLKVIVKDLFPTIDLGQARTFANIIASIDALKNDWEHRGTKTPALLRKNSNQQSKKDNKFANNLSTTLKTMPNIDYGITQQQEIEQDNRKRFKNDPAHKETTSTLLESIRSANSIKQKIKLGLSNPATPLKPPKQIPMTPIEQKKRRKTSLVVQTKQLTPLPNEKAQPLTPKNPLELRANNAIVAVDEIAKKPKQSQLLQSSEIKNNISNLNRAYMKTSQTSRRLMSMSIEIESEINNLFGSNDDMINSNYYARVAELQAVRNSVLSKVAQQFEDLF